MKEIEYKYQVDITMSEAKQLFKLAGPALKERIIDYNDHYFIPDITGYTVPYFERVRVGESRTEFTFKSLKNDINPAIRTEFNFMITEPAQVFLAYMHQRAKYIGKLTKTALIYETAEVVLTYDKINGAENMLEIELKDPANQSLNILDKYENLLGFSADQRIYELLFELYFPYKLERKRVK